MHIKLSLVQNMKSLLHSFALKWLTGLGKSHLYVYTQKFYIIVYHVRYHKTRVSQQSKLWPGVGQIKEQMNL